MKRVLTVLPTLMVVYGTIAAGVGVVAHAAPVQASPPSVALKSGPSPTAPPIRLTLPAEPANAAPQAQPDDLQAAPPPTPTTPSAASPPAAEPAPAPGAPAPTPREVPALSAREIWEQGPRNRIAVMPHYVHRMSSAGRAVTPASGFGIAGTIELAYLRLFPGWEGALGVDFSHDRFASSELGGVMVDGSTEMFRNPRVTSETSFVLVHTAAAILGAVRPYVTVGLGVGLGYFDSEATELRPGTARATHALGRLAAGMDVTVAPNWCVTVRAAYTAVKGTSTMITDGGDTLSLFGNLLDVGAGLAYRF